MDISTTSTTLLSQLSFITESPNKNDSEQITKICHILRFETECNEPMENILQCFVKQLILLDLKACLLSKDNKQHFVSVEDLPTTWMELQKNFPQQFWIDDWTINWFSGLWFAVQNLFSNQSNSVLWCGLLVTNSALTSLLCVLKSLLCGHCSLLQLLRNLKSPFKLPISHLTAGFSGNTHSGSITSVTLEDPQSIGSNPTKDNQWPQSPVISQPPCYMSVNFKTDTSPPSPQFMMPDNKSKVSSDKSNTTIHFKSDLSVFLSPVSMSRWPTNSRLYQADHSIERWILSALPPSHTTSSTYTTRHHSHQPVCQASTSYCCPTQKIQDLQNTIP